jgi:NADPH:quinone reductase
MTPILNVEPVATGAMGYPAFVTRNCRGGGRLMLGLVNTPNGKAPVELRELPEPRPQRNEALVAVHAFSLNRGELRLFRNRGRLGPRPGRRRRGLKQAEDGSGPPAGSRVVALTDEFGWAQRIAVPRHRMAVLPDNVGFAQAATLPVAGLIALRTLRHGAPLLGKRVLI